MFESSQDIPRPSPSASAGALGGKQGKLGQQQDELGRQQAELAQRAARQMNELLDDAISKKASRSPSCRARQNIVDAISGRSCCSVKFQKGSFFSPLSAGHC